MPKATARRTGSDALTRSPPESVAGGTRAAAALAARARERAATLRVACCTATPPPIRLTGAPVAKPSASPHEVVDSPTVRTSFDGMVLGPADFRPTLRLAFDRDPESPP